MTVSRTLNGKPITEEELSKIVLTNPTIESICAGVIARLQKANRDNFDNGKINTLPVEKAV